MVMCVLYFRQVDQYLIQPLYGVTTRQSSQLTAIGGLRKYKRDH